MAKVEHPSFTSIPDIIRHVRGRNPELFYIANNYTIADLIKDLERICPPSFVFEDIQY